MAARPVVKISSMPARVRTLKTLPAGPETPMGLGKPPEGARAKVLPRAHATIAMPAAHATGRQRREGSEPVGKSSSTNTTNPMPKPNSQPTQLPQVRVRGNCSSSNPAPAASAYDAAVADMSQPIGFAGRFHISSAPTVAKPPMNATAATASAPFPVPAWTADGSG